VYSYYYIIAIPCEKPHPLPGETSCITGGSWDPKEGRDFRGMPGGYVGRYAREGDPKKFPGIPNHTPGTPPPFLFESWEFLQVSLGSLVIKDRELVRVTWDLGDLPGK